MMSMDAPHPQKGMRSQVCNGHIFDLWYPTIVVVFPHYGSSSLGRCDDYKNLSASLHVCSRESAAAIVQMQTKPDSMLLRSYVVS